MGEALSLGTSSKSVLTALSGYRARRLIVDVERRLMTSGLPERTRLPRRRPPSSSARAHSGLERWVRSQVINSSRHAAALRPFRSREFGNQPASPSESHRVAVNRLVGSLRGKLLQAAQELSELGGLLSVNAEAARVGSFHEAKARTTRLTTATETVWDFYLELFNQRRSHVADMLLACDRIGLDCYQAVYTGLGRARSIPSPAPFSYMETRLAPATFRRGVRARMLARMPNPFPLVKLPYHRLMNPWTLGAVPHEVAHNLQADLGLWALLPRAIHERLLHAGLPASIADVWARWHKETFADLCGLLLSGPSFVESLMDVVGRLPRRVMHFNPRGVHPVAYLRVFINLELLRRLGFRRDARRYRQAWRQLYPDSLAERLPAGLIDTFPAANRLVVDTICFKPYRQLGDKSLAGVISFQPKDQLMVREAAYRLAAGTNPGVLPARYFIGASRVALSQQFARPGTITQHFYKALARR